MRGVRFAGDVIDSRNDAYNDYWLFAKVTDGGEPGYLVDTVWGDLTDEITAINGVTTPGTPGYGEFDITSGNVQVHKSS